MFAAHSNVPCGLTVSYLGDGSSAGLNDLLQQQVDFAATDIPLTNGALARSQHGPILHIPVTLGSEAIIYHVIGVPSQLRLTGPVLADIFLGQITAWDDPAIAQLNPGVALPPQSITVIHRSEGSGTTGIFTHYLAEVSPSWKTQVGAGYTVNWPAGIGFKGNGGVADAVQEITGSIAYVELSYALRLHLPYAVILSGEVQDWRALAHRTIEELSGAGLSLLLERRVQAIDPAHYRVTVVHEDGQARSLPYDRLIIAMGATSVHPPITGLDLPGVYPLRFMADAFAVQQHLEACSPRSAVLIGGGYIGMEMADALTRRGLAVTVVEHAASVLKTVDPGFGTRVRDELQRHGIRVETDVRVERIEREDTQLLVTGSNRFHTTADLVLVGVGVEPNSQLACVAGIEVGERGAIRVTRKMETNLPDIYAAGDCVETWHRVLNHPTYLPLGSTAHKQGRIAGENAVGGTREFAGTLGTQVVKVFDLVIARMGLRDDEAARAGFDPFTVETITWDHKVYYP
jgi:NADPH-dependent 2,4-dienoyl-CoA reductase/sulfur reductase-like enzyme